MKGIFKFEKKHFVRTFMVIVLVLFVLRLIFPEWVRPLVKMIAPSSQTATIDTVEMASLRADSLLQGAHELPQDLSVRPTNRKHRILSVSSFERTFNDLNDVQLTTASRLGMPPVQDRGAAAAITDGRLVYAGNSPFYMLKRLDNSIPYLVPRAQRLLSGIARTFVDSLMVKGVPPSLLIVTSLTRTRNDVARLQRHNSNATANSCHCYGTTFDISYTKYAPLQDPNGPTVRPVRDDTLKWVLSEVLRDMRAQGLCYVKYEKKQGCYHITAR